jgi:nicotinamidase/pyrazinamidase
MKVLLLVDIQNDFSPTGTLPVKDGDAIIPFVNQKQNKFDLIVATQDWHPQNHGSFAINHPDKTPGDMITLGNVDQILWPAHCVQETEGAEFIPGLKINKINQIVQKGMNENIDSYSGFFDNDHQVSTGLHQYLQDHKIGEVYIVGLATDYCVKFTALDATQLGYSTTVFKDGVRGVDLTPGDVEKAFTEMQAAGVKII